MADDLNNVETSENPTPSEPIVPTPELAMPVPELASPIELTPVPALIIEETIPASASVPEPVITEPAPTPVSVPEPEALAPVTVSEAKALPVATPVIEVTEDYSLIKPSKGFMAWLRAKAQVAIRALRQKKLDRLMTLFDKKSQVTNDMVEKFLRVSHTTATKYLNILVKEGKLKRQGQGSAVHYEKV